MNSLYFPVKGRGLKEFNFQEIRLKYGFKLRLNDLLIKPIQRLTKYHMLLEVRNGGKKSPTD